VLSDASECPRSWGTFLSQKGTTESVAPVGTDPLLYNSIRTANRLDIRVGAPKQDPTWKCARPVDNMAEGCRDGSWCPDRASKRTPHERDSCACNLPSARVCSPLTCQTPSRATLPALRGVEDVASVIGSQRCTDTRRFPLPPAPCRYKRIHAACPYETRYSISPSLPTVEWTLRNSLAVSPSKATGRDAGGGGGVQVSHAGLQAAAQRVLLHSPKCP
jgi:hypothetical protein